MSKKFKWHTRGRRRQLKTTPFSLMGQLAEARFFRIVEARAARLPPEIKKVEQSNYEMDRTGGVDVIVEMAGGIKLYVDLKSTLNSLGYCGLSTLSLPFLVLAADSDDAVFEKFVAFALAEHAKIVARREAYQRELIAAQRPAMTSLAPAE